MSDLPRVKGQGGRRIFHLIGNKSINEIPLPNPRRHSDGSRRSRLHTHLRLQRLHIPECAPLEVLHCSDCCDRLQPFPKPEPPTPLLSLQALLPIDDRTPNT